MKEEFGRFKKKKKKKKAYRRITQFKIENKAVLRSGRASMAQVSLTNNFGHKKEFLAERVEAGNVCWLIRHYSAVALFVSFLC